EGVRRLELEARGKRGHASEQSLRVRGEQPVAPIDSPAQRPLSLGRVLRTGRQQVEAATEAVEDLFRCERLHARGSELQRERKPVEPLCDPTYRGIGLEAGLEFSRAFREECGRVVQWER